MYHLFSQHQTRLNLGLRLRKLALPLIALAVSAAATSALASTITLIPIPSWATNNQNPTASAPNLNATNYGGVLHQNEARSITPDGKYVVGLCYDWSNLATTHGNVADHHDNYLAHCIDQISGYFYNVADNSLGRPVAGSYAAAVTGVAYRTNNSGVVETVANGFGGGWMSQYMTVNGGTNWGSKVRSLSVNFTSGGGPILPLANTIGATTNSDVWYSIIQGFQPYENSLEYAYVFSGSNSWNSSHFDTNGLYFQTYRGDNGEIPVNTGNMIRMNGVAATGRQVGRYVDGGLEWLGAPYEGYYGTAGGILSFVIEYPPPPMGGSGSPPYNNMYDVWPFAGLDGTLLGTAWAITPDGNTIFGHSPTNTGSWWYGYKALATADVESVTSVQQLPVLPDTVGQPGAGATWTVIPFGCSTDGRYAVGVDYRGATLGERAVLWDTGDADANNWTVVDLTDVAASEGALGNFTKLERAYSVGVNGSGQPVVTGYGKYLDGTTLRNRAFVMVVAPPAARPEITSITGAGTGTVTVYYTNTVATKSYTLQYCTSLSATPTWNNAGTKVATGTSDSQTESSVTSAVRFYRVSYTP